MWEIKSGRKHWPAETTDSRLDFHSDRLIFDFGFVDDST